MSRTIFGTVVIRTLSPWSRTNTTHIVVHLPYVMHSYALVSLSINWGLDPTGIGQVRVVILYTFGQL